MSIQKFYYLDDAINCEVNTKTVFIIVNEYKKKSGETGRYYMVFPKFKDFLNNREKYTHCHEIIVNHKNNKVNTAGRLVFDFDIENKIIIPDNFTDQIEGTIIDVIDNYFTGVDSAKFEYIWSTSTNPKKFSKHLTVKNLYFDNWISISKIFYELFILVWKDKYDWIDPTKLIDKQILKNKASLRMVGSSKINGCVLEFDNDKYDLTDSLIRIYFKNQRDSEQLITLDNFDSDINLPVKKINRNYEVPIECVDLIYSQDIYDKSFEILNNLQPNVFKIIKISGRIINLQRLKSNSCLLSKENHDSENGYIFIVIKGSDYKVKFGCHRECSTKKNMVIGNISIVDSIPRISPNLKKLIRT